MVIWLTGLSGSGKTTLARALHDLLAPVRSGLVLLDGDAVREAFHDGLGYRESDRIVQVTRVQKIARLLAEQDLVVIVCLVYANADLLEWNRSHIANYFEVHVKASVKTVEARDNKGLYRAARRGEITDVVGVDIPAWEPTAPDLIVDADRPEEPAVLARRVALEIPMIASLVEGG
jgi:adenylyl-sulfate kinase